MNDRYEKDDFERFICAGGDTFCAFVEFADPARAYAIMPYGNSGRKKSPHNTDQLPLYAEKRVRNVLLHDADIEKDTQRVTYLDR